MTELQEQLNYARKMLDNTEAAALNDLWQAAANAADALTTAAIKLEIELRRRERG